jgi:hypothetical protein
MLIEHFVANHLLDSSSYLWNVALMDFLTQDSQLTFNKPLQDVDAINVMDKNP